VDQEAPFFFSMSSPPEFREGAARFPVASRLRKGREGVVGRPDGDGGLRG
jgi:hypothetical protein